MKRKVNIGIKPLMISIISAISILLCMTFAILSFNNKSAKELAYECLADKAGLYIELLEKEMVKVSQTLKIMQMRDLDVMWKIPNKVSPQDTEYYEVWKELKEYNFSKATEYNHKYSFYEYVYDADLMMIGEATYFDSSIKSAYLSCLTQEIRNICEKDSDGVVWNFFTLEGQDYLYGCFQREGKAVGCITSLDVLLEDIQITNLGYEGFLLFEDDGQFYADEKAYNEAGIEELLPELQKESGQKTDRFVWDTYTIRYLGNVRIVITLTGGVLEQIEGVQILSIVISVLLFLRVLLILWYLYSGVLWPMKKFVDRLKDPDEELYLNQKEDDGPLEIVYASEQFKKMYREIQSLRIDVYEKELAEKKTMLDYAQVQIRPHFFLNCMSVVQSMAELHHEDDIVHILDVLSEYMRYVLKDTFEMRCIRDEIRHVCNYMDMQKLCKPDAFTFNAIVEEDVEECKILPLVIQTFAENAVKHGLAAERCIEITIYITSMKIGENDFLYIVISDTGNGFPEQILELIETDQPIVYDGCEHIGIRNTLQRIRMAYGEKADIKLSNMRENYGAVVEITLPMEKEN